MIENKFPGKDISDDDLKSKIPKVAKKDINHYSEFEIAGVKFGKGFCPVFAGPNMVEGEEFIQSIAKNLKHLGASFLRGGAFKPLTFPYRSDKYNESRLQGIQWLSKAKEKTGLPIITEVMEIKYLNDIAKVTDILQIGTRNMQNYPLLVASAQTGLPIMLKRGFGSSLRDWLGAAEYILNEGNNKVILCERGVVAPHTHRATSRFLLDLQVIPAAKEITHLPVITDPSHATFWRSWVAPMTLASLGAGADGIMIEVHPNPTEAAVDPLQPIDYKEFDELMNLSRNVAKALGYKKFANFNLK